MKYLKPAFAASLAAAALSVSACGGSNGSASAPMKSIDAMHTTGAASTTAPSGAGVPAAGPHNTADIEFTQGMIPHHAQAVEMADLILAHTDNAQVKALAARIKSAQAPEIASMSGWLAGWGEKLPTMGAGMSMGGMMSQADMGRLKAAPMGMADKIFLTLMPEHHQGAIAMAKLELSDGANPQAKSLAQSIIDSQTAEIAEMKTLLSSIS